MTSWLLGIDDTDTAETPGTNKLVLHLADKFGASWQVRWIVRHQLLVDPRIPYTSHNGCASLLVESRLGADELAERLVPAIVAWCPPGSDPGLCIAARDTIGDEIIEFGRRCQREVVSPEDAQRTAARRGVRLESLGGTGDGVIGALAAVGLLATRDDGRILESGCGQSRWSDITGWQTVDDLAGLGVRAVRLDTRQNVLRGRVLLSKRLRPNLRGGEAVLFVEPAAETSAGDEAWQALKVV